MKDMKPMNDEAARVVLGLFSDFRCVFLTGSRAFGWHTKESDFDVCILSEDKDRAIALVESLSKDVQHSKYFDSSKAHEIPITVHNIEWRVCINPIPLHPLDMLCWGMATKEIQHIGGIDSGFLSNREHKHGAFELLRGFYKQSIRYQGADKTLVLLESDQFRFKAIAAMERKLAQKASAA